MELLEMWTTFRRGLGWIALVAVIAAGFAGVLSRFVLPKVYNSTATLIVILPGQSSGVLSSMVTGQQLVNTYATIAGSQTVLRSAAQRIGGPSAATLAKTVTVTAVANTDLLTVTANAHRARQAADAANTVASQAALTVRRLTGSANLVLADRAIVPARPVSPKMWLNIGLAGVLGIFLSAAVLTLRELLDDTFKTDEEVVRHLGIPVLATVPVVVRQDMVPALVDHAHGRTRLRPRRLSIDGTSS
ncbi:MAG: Wzz/FepE/Etk N-terminal domain-containing protein [Thermaerobacter sp.]|nr:Wzz/FepE/Etk N-terminal domain-containing protein [Thermaerobacter sp.]